MTQGERVKEIRKGLNLTLEKFGERVGVTKQTVSRIENGVNNLTDQMALAICREFSINEHWLRTGEGEPYIKGSEDELAELVGRLYKDKGSMRYKMSLELCRAMEKMTDEQLKGFGEFVKRLAEAATSEE